MNKSKGNKKDIAIEMYKVCGEFCQALEQAEKLPLHEILDTTAVLLMNVYRKTFAITRFQTKYENEAQHFLSEKQYNKIRNTLKGIFDKKDNYTENIDPNRPNARENFQASLSEDLTDIYQDFYDFVTWYSDGTFESMNDSIIELLNNYDKYWGIKLLNVLRAIHVIRYMKKDASLFNDPLGDDDKGADTFDDDDEVEDTEALDEFLKEDL
jgi:hypothetical protein